MKTPKRILSLVLALIMMLGVMSPVLIPASAGETYTITVTASPSEGGTVTGGGTYESGSTALIYAVPNSGWHFVRWNSASGTIDEQSFAFVVRGNAGYTAVFEKDVVISIVPDKTEALPGETVNYTLKIGPVSNLAKIRFVLSIPEGLKFVDLSSNEIDALIISLMQKLNIDAYTHISFVNSSKMLDAYGGNYSSDSDTEIMTFSCTVKSGASGEKAVGLTSCKLTDTGNNEILINTSDLQSAIEVITIPATSISLDKTTLNLTERETASLTATIRPENSTDTVT